MHPDRGGPGEPDRAIAALDGADALFYEDLEWYLRKAGDRQTPFTSAVPLFRALAVTVQEIEEEGMPERIARQHRQAAAFRQGLRAIGLELFPTVDGPSEPSKTVTAISLPAGVREDPNAFFGEVDEEGVAISVGQAHLGGEIFRVSNWAS